jgi:predicted DNA-binding WGR domain protein
MHAEFYLKAQDDEVGIYRYYNLSIVLTLFKEYALCIAHGRIGLKARQRSLCFTQIQDLAKTLKHILNKRLKAEKRIGCPYKIISHTYDTEFEQTVCPYLSGMECL